MNIGQALGSPLKLGTFIRGGSTPERLVEADGVPILCIQASGVYTPYCGTGVDVGIVDGPGIGA